MGAVEDLDASSRLSGPLLLCDTHGPLSGQGQHDGNRYVTGVERV